MPALAFMIKSYEVSLVLSMVDPGLAFRGIAGAWWLCLVPFYYPKFNGPYGFWIIDLRISGGYIRICCEKQPCYVFSDLLMLNLFIMTYRISNSPVIKSSNNFSFVI